MNFSVERFLLNDYSKHTSSTYAITKYIQDIKIDGVGTVTVDLWDTAGQVYTPFPIIVACFL